MKKIHRTGGLKWLRFDVLFYKPLIRSRKEIYLLDEMELKRRVVLTKYHVFGKATPDSYL